MSNQNTIEYSTALTINPPRSPIPNLPTDTLPPTSPDQSNFLQWTSTETSHWLLSLGFDISVINAFKDNAIIGETLPYLTNAHYQEMGLSITERIKLKLEINKLLTNNDYHDPDQLDTTKHIVDSLNEKVTEVLQIRYDELIDELKTVKAELVKGINSSKASVEQNIKIDTGNSAPVRQVLTAPSRSKDTPLSSTTISGSRTPQEFLARKPSMSKKTSSASVNKQSSSLSSSPTTPSTLIPNTSTPSSTTAKKPLTEPLKQLRASTEDPCSKILQAAMKRHNLTNADWRKYALVICYGDKERILGLDEKPVLVFKELREKGEHPAIMLRQRAESLEDSGYISPGNSTPGGKL